MAEMGIKAGARQVMESWNHLGMVQTGSNPHKHSSCGCRDQEQPVGHLFVLLERWCCELGVV